MPGSTDVVYLVLPDTTKPYLLARVRWPDVFQALSAGCPVWQEDPGLFDLPYDPNSVPVTLDRAEAIAKGWGAQLPTIETRRPNELTLIRRMPADWSNLSPAEKRAWSLQFMKTTPGPATSELRAASHDVVETPRSRFGRWRSRRQAVAPTPPLPIDQPKPILDLTAESDNGDSTTQRPALPATALDLRDTSTDSETLIDEPATS